MEVINDRHLIDESVGTCLDHARGDVELKDVFFSYPSRPQVPVLQGLSLHLLPGQSVALVGSSGSGKSTVISLLERFYEPASGEILLDGHNIKRLQLKWLRAQIGLVNQEPALFATSILQNILYGNDSATLEEVENAAKVANAHEFISQLPHGYQTQVGARGVQLSGGQKQRVAIARALVKNPLMVLLDEATSALDTESEKLVQDALNRIMVGRTTLVVAHRLSTIQNADLIAVMQNGKLVETGSHSQLMDQNGVYSVLVQLQENKATFDSSSSRLSGSSSRTNSFRQVSSVDERGSFRLSKLRILSFTSREEEDMQSFEVEAKQARPLVQRLVKISLPELPILLLGLGGAVCAGLPNPAYSFLISKILEVYYLKDFDVMKRDIVKYIVILVMVAVGAFFAYLVQHWCISIAGENLTKRVREMMLSGILRNEISWFDQEENGSSYLASRLASDATYIRTATGDVLATLAQNTSVIVASFVMAFVIQWKLAIVVAATFPLIVGSIFGQKLFLQGFAGDIETSHARASTIAGEALSNIRTVAAFNAQDKIVNLFISELKTPAKQNSLRGNVIGLAFGFSNFCLFSSYGLGLWYGALLVKDNKAKFGDVLQAFLLLILAAFPIGESLALLPDISRAGHAISSVFHLLDRETVINPDDSSAYKVKKLRGDLELREVEFTYPSRPEAPIFTGLNLKLSPGKSMALVGSSGCGKSSVLALIQRFYDPQKGVVLVDGRDLKKLNLKSYRRHVGLVPQEPALFAMSIRENIMYGRIKDDGQASEAEVVSAARAANAHGFISGLPRGYDTDVGERGVQLSGGEKQRVAVARAVLKDPKILLMDEATSALDAETERVVQEAVERIMRGRTSVVVAHRLSSVRKADEIVVIQDGGVVELGKHSELVARGGAYAALVKLQTT